MSSIVHIKETVKSAITDVSEELHEVPLSKEEDDHLTPLMQDNHTVLEHQETFKASPIIMTTRLMDVANRVHEIPEFKPYHPPMKNCDKQDSISSIDSDTSRPSSFDRQCSLDDSSGHLSSNQCDSSSSDAAISSDENAKDSGCDMSMVSCEKKMDKDEFDENTEPLEIPDDEMAAKIAAQVEFYFSNENILKDAFLLKHVRRNKEGFVSLKLISSFKRVRQLVKDWRVVGYAIKLKSTFIEPNELGTKVRRTEPLPVFDETMPSRTVVATDIPLEKLTIEKVSDLFSKCGEIALIRILRPNGSIPADVRQFYNKHPDLHEQECALVEFTESQSARLAQNLSATTSMQIYEMIAPKKKTGKKAPQQSVSKFIENYKYPSHGDIERSRGGVPIEQNDFHNKYNNSIRRMSGNYYQRQQQPTAQPMHHDASPPQQQHICQHRRTSFGNAGNTENCEHYSNVNRRISNCSINSTTDMPRKYSNCSEGYLSCSSGSETNMSRRASFCSDSSSRRASNCSADMQFRRTSNCSDFCSCSMRRTSQCSSDSRRQSQCNMEHGKRYANNMPNYERRISNVSDNRRVSFDNDYNDRKISNGSIGYEHHHRKISSGFDSIRKLSSGDKFFDGRKASTDSGYDRRSSIGSIQSDYATSPRITRANSLVTSSAATAIIAPGPVSKAETLVRTPIGPDGSKGFASRARKIGQVIGPV